MSKHIGNGAPDEDSTAIGMVQKTITQEHQLIQHSLDNLNRSNSKIIPGKDQLDADNIAFIATMVDQLEKDSSYLAAWSVVWANDRRPLSGSCKTHNAHPDFFYEFLALKDALRVCPDHQSLTLVTMSATIVQYVKRKKLYVKGEWVKEDKYPYLLKPLLQEIKRLMLSRTGKFYALILHEEPSWIVQLKDSARIIAASELHQLRLILTNKVSKINSTTKKDLDAKVKDDLKRPVHTHKRVSGDRSVLRSEVHPNPRFFQPETSTMQCQDEHLNSFLPVPKRPKRIRKASEPAEVLSSHATLLDPVGEGSSMIGIKSSDSTASLGIHTDHDSNGYREGQVDNAVATNVDDLEKHKVETSNADSDDDIYVDAMEYLDDN